MPNSRAHSSLYRLVEAGRLVRSALAEPLLARGLEPGDDAILLLLDEQAAMPAEDMAEALGMPLAGLLPHLQRLLARELLEEDAMALRLTARGARLRQSIEQSWMLLDKRLFGDLKGRQKKALQRRLAAIILALRA